MEKGQLCQQFINYNPNDRPTHWRPRLYGASLLEDKIATSSITSSFSYCIHLSLLKFPIQIDLSKRKGQKNLPSMVDVR